MTAAATTYDDADLPLLQGLMITGSTILAAVIYRLDTTIANIALPHIQGSMSAIQEQIGWVLTSYIVAGAILTAPTAFLARRYGRRRVFATAIASFTVMSVLTGLATSLGQVVFFRFLQGAAGAALVPLSQAIIIDTWPPEKRGQAMAYWGAGMMAGPILGPALGGYLTELYNWRWVFFINVPIGAVCLAGVLASMPESEVNNRSSFDVFGFVLLSLGIGALQLMLDRGQLQGWFGSTEILIEALVASFCLYMFVVHITTTKGAFVDPSLFRDRNLAVGTIMIFFVAVLFITTLALLPIFTQNFLNIPVLTAGLILVPRGIGQLLSTLFIGRLAHKVDDRVLMLAGYLVNTFALWRMSRYGPDVAAWDVTVDGLIQGIGIGLLFVPLSNITFSTLDKRWTTDGTVLFNLLRNIGGSVGIAVAIALIARATQLHYSYIREAVSVLGTDLAALPSAWHPGTTAGAMALNGEITRQATMFGYILDFKLLMWISLLSIPMLLLFRMPRERRGRR